MAATISTSNKGTIVSEDYDLSNVKLNIMQYVEVYAVPSSSGVASHGAIICQLTNKTSGKKYSVKVTGELNNLVNKPMFGNIVADSEESLSYGSDGSLSGTVKSGDTYLLEIDVSGFLANDLMFYISTLHFNSWHVKKGSGKASMQAEETIP